MNKIKYLISTLVLTFILCGCQRDNQNHREKTKNYNSIDIIYNHPLTIKNPEYLGQCRVEICQTLLESINNAKESIDFAIYGMENQKEILNALLEAKARGVKIRGVFDVEGDGKNNWEETHKLTELFSPINIKNDHENEILRQSFKGKYYPRIMHNKFFIIDNCVIWTGSANITENGIGGYNTNIVALINSCQIGKIYQQEFQQMYLDNKFNRSKNSYLATRKPIELENNTTIEIYFSPQDKTMSERIIPLINQAKNRIDIGIFYLTHPQVTDALIVAHQRGVLVRVILDNNSAKHPASTHKRLQKAGIPVNTENQSSKIHLKSAAIDNSYLIIGSMNWTKSGDFYNDENTLIINDPILAHEFHQFFDNLWHGNCKIDKIIDD